MQDISKALSLFPIKICYVGGKEENYEACDGFRFGILIVLGGVQINQFFKF